MNTSNLHEVLQNLYQEMIPLSSQMALVAKSIAGLGALFYIGLKVWQALARAEPIDVYPMLRPFAMGICIMFFPTLVLGTLNAVLSPVVRGTHEILESQVMDLTSLQQQKDVLEREAMLRNPETAYLVSNEEYDKKLNELGWSPSDIATMAGMYLEKEMYKMQKSIRDGFRELLEMLFQAAALVIDTIRTFFLVVLSILGPLAFAISIWSGFESTLVQWLTRYISVYLWLPVADLFSAMLAKIQTLIIERDMQMLADPSFIPDASNTVYVIFMIIGIVGYFTVPTVTGWVIQAGGAGNFMRNMNKTVSTAGNMATAGAGAAVGNISGKLMKK
ncbi:conjugative transposon protein TraJ [Myroides sp. BIT-d1]|uniref:Conjugative transposon protein TraJ n=1 Tax=Myroides albus TaxID=2562892 RepID=A0A6I3LI21_9FLAO|nr:conjugative transposon protein TraJ [Myroides albus]MTG99229.1 conjugative transposon protein TraJ [Myroides albus]